MTTDLESRRVVYSLLAGIALVLLVVGVFIAR